MEGPILVSAGIIRENNRLLIARRKSLDDYGGLWEFPGGKVEYGESPEECLIREIEEELKINIEIKDLVDVTSFVYPDNRHFIILFFNCNFISGDITLSSHDEFKWIELSDLNNFEFVDADRSIVSELFRYNGDL